MPWRLIFFIILFAFFLFMIAFNLDNKCDISFGFGEAAPRLRDVPVFLTAFSAFILGMLCALPYIIKYKLKSRSDQPEKNGNGKAAKTKGKKKENYSPVMEDASFSDGGPYGVN